MPTQPGRQKRHNVAKSLEESALFKTCRTDLSQLSPKVEKLAMPQKIPMDFTSERNQVKVLASLFRASTSHSD